MAGPHHGPAARRPLRFEGVRVSTLSPGGGGGGDGEWRVDAADAAVECWTDEGGGARVRYGDGRSLSVGGDAECARLPRGYVVNDERERRCCAFRFARDADARAFAHFVEAAKKTGGGGGGGASGGGESAFSQRTDDSSASQYFQFYGYLSQQQNMMQDYVRTGTYQRAILDNAQDFRDKVVLDVGAGSGILSFFCVQAGAARVYAVEASNMARHARALVDANRLSDRVRVIAGKIEEIELPEPVDVIVSEPMGYMLYNERMLETYLHAKKWLRPGGKMFPSRGDLHVAPFTDDALYMEQCNKANFWYQTCFHGVDLSALRAAATREYFRQPVVDTFDVRICMAKSVRHVVDFLEADESDLHRIEVPFRFKMLQSGTCHGLAFWFDVAFAGSAQCIWLSTAPTEPLTHWYQVRCLLESPVFCKQGHVLAGRVLLVANERQSYDVTMEMWIEGTSIVSSNTLDLKNPYFRYTGAPAAPPPGVSGTSPSESYWSALDNPPQIAQLAQIDAAYGPACDPTYVNPNMIKTVMLQDDFVKRIGVGQNGDA